MATPSSIAAPLPFDQVYDLVKNNKQDAFPDVYRSLLIRPDYVSVIPPKGEYSIFHYLVIHGALDLFNKVIAIPNLRFNPLTKTATKPSKDIAQISMENRNKSPTHRKLSDAVSNLVTLDKFVDYGKKNQIDDCKRMLQQDDDLANQKPPYRKFYLIHHLAYAGNQAGFDQLRQMCQLDMTLLTSDQQTASEVALEQNHTELARYLEELSPKMREIREKHEKDRLQKTQEETKQNEKMEQSIASVGNENLIGAFTCPLTKEVFRDPVVLCDGFTYERAAIQRWLDLGHRRSPMTNIELANTELEAPFKYSRRYCRLMSTSSSLTYDQAYKMAHDGYTGESTVWDNIFNYIAQHPKELFLIAPNRRWSIAHQIVYHGNLKLLQRILALYKDENSIDIQSKANDPEKPSTILDVAKDRKGYYKEQLAFIEHLFTQDKFLRACKACQWPVIEEMLANDRSLVNEKPPYYPNYFLHYLALEGDTRTLGQYDTSDISFDFSLRNVDGKTALDLARDRKNHEFVNQLQQMMAPKSNSDDRRSPDPLPGSQKPTASAVVPSPPTDKTMICPITKKLFVDPVIASDGQTYERSAITAWLQENRYSVLTGELITDVFIENTAMKQLIARRQQST